MTMPLAATDESLQLYCGWVADCALPLWADRGFNARAGHFFERLDWDGHGVNVPLRSMVQARQIYVFADAARRGWLPEGGTLAEEAMASLIRTYAQPQDDTLSFAFSADDRGNIVSDTRDTYGHAFILFALAAVFRLTGDAHLLDAADQTINFLDERVADQQNGGFDDALPAGRGAKRQNPHMHLLEAFLFLDEAAPGRGYLERAAKIVALFKDKLFDASSGCLAEYFADDWGAAVDPVRRIIWEPGHHFEWAWLLGEFCRRRGESVEPTVSVLMEKATRYGVAPSCRIWDELATDDMRVLKASSRVWPHTEAIKAFVQDAKVEGHALTSANKMAKILLADYLDRPFAGGWIDHLTAEGSPLVDYVPASTLYHLHLAATEVAGILPAIRQQSAA